MLDELSRRTKRRVKYALVLKGGSVLGERARPRPALFYVKVYAAVVRLARAESDRNEFAKWLAYPAKSAFYVKRIRN